MLILAKSIAIGAALILGTTTGVTAGQGDPAPRPTTSKAAGVTTDSGSTVFETDQSQLTVLPSTGPQPSDTELRTMAANISCDLNVQYVHGSTHVSGTINGVAVVTCSAAAAQITLHYSLIRISSNNTVTQWGAPSKSLPNTKTLQNNRAVGCIEGPAKFQGWAQGVIVPPAGYTLVGPATNSKYGATQQVACGVASLVAADAGRASETTTISFVRSDLAR